MRRLAMAIALACTLSGVTRAGEIPSTGAVAPRPQHPTISGEIHTTGAATPSTMPIAGEIHSTGAKAPQPPSTLLAIILTVISIGR